MHPRPSSLVPRPGMRNRHPMRLTQSLELSSFRSERWPRHYNRTGCWQPLGTAAQPFPESCSVSPRAFQGNKDAEIFASMEQFQNRPTVPNFLFILGNALHLSPSHHSLVQHEDCPKWTEKSNSPMLGMSQAAPRVRSNATPLQKVPEGRQGVSRI